MRACVLKNANLLANIGADTAENKRNFANNLRNNWDLPYQVSLGDRARRAAEPFPRRSEQPRAVARGGKGALSLALEVIKEWSEYWIEFSPQTSRGSFSAVSTPIFASKYALESSRRDLHNALLCTVL